MIELYKCLIFGMFSQLESIPGCDNKISAISKCLFLIAPINGVLFNS